MNLLSNFLKNVLKTLDLKTNYKINSSTYLFTVFVYFF